MPLATRITKIREIQASDIVGAVNEAVHLLKTYTIAIGGRGKMGRRATITGLDGFKQTEQVREKGRGTFGVVYALPQRNLALKVVKTKKYKDMISELSISLLVARMGIGPSMPTKAAAGMMANGTGFGYVMELFQGDLIRMMLSPAVKYISKEDMKYMERQIRVRVEALLKAGIVCTDLKSGNVLCSYNAHAPAGRRIDAVLADFDAFFCCAARKQLFDEVVNKAALPFIGGPAFVNYAMSTRSHSCRFPQWGNGDSRRALLALSLVQIYSAANHYAMGDKSYRLMCACTGVPFIAEARKVAQWTRYEVMVRRTISTGVDMAGLTDAFSNLGLTKKCTPNQKGILRAFTAFYGTAKRGEYATVENAQRMVAEARASKRLKCPSSRVLRQPKPHKHGHVLERRAIRRLHAKVLKKRQPLIEEIERLVDETHTYFKKRGEDFTREEIRTTVKDMMRKEQEKKRRQRPRILNAV